MHFTKVPYARKTIFDKFHLYICSSGMNSKNGYLWYTVAHKYAFARIPNRTKHKVALCLNFKFLPKKNIVKKL